jgi:hypothetical protein
LASLFFVRISTHYNEKKSGINGLNFQATVVSFVGVATLGWLDFPAKSNQVYKVAFDMNTFGTRSQKPTMLLTNSKSVCKLHGRRFKKRRTGKALCKRYKSKDGKAAFSGTKRLKKSQTLS